MAPTTTIQQCAFVTPVRSWRNNNQHQQYTVGMETYHRLLPLKPQHSNLQLSGSSLLLSSSSTTLSSELFPLESATTTATSTTFDAVLPDTSILIGFGIIVILCTIAANVWANQVVPISRTKLAIAKQKSSNSTLRVYLDELLEIENSSIVINRDNSTTTALSVDLPVNATNANINERDQRMFPVNGTNVGNGSTTTGTRLDGNRAFERWLFTDWLVKDSNVRKGGRQKEPAIPILKKAKWNSGDNPVLVATTMILLGVILTSISERVTSFVPN